MNDIKVKDRLACVDWRNVLVAGIDSLIDSMVDEANALAEAKARRRVELAWSCSGFVTSLLIIASSTKTWGSTTALFFMCVMMVITTVRTYRAYKTMRKKHDAVDVQVNELVKKFPRSNESPLT